MTRVPILLALVVAAVIAGASEVSASGSPNSWSTGASMLAGRSGLVVALSSANNQVYAIDGQTAASTYTGRNDSYNPATDTWTATSGVDKSPAAGDAFVATSDGLIWVFGGTSGAGVLTTTQYYTPTTNKWSTAPSLPVGVNGAGAAVGSDNRIYVIGGSNGSAPVSTVDAYDPSARKWYCSGSGTGCTATATPPVAMPTARSNVAVAAYGGLIYVAGGQSSTGYTGVIEAYNPSTRVWTCSSGDAGAGCSSSGLAPMPTARATALTVSNGILYAIGGSNGSNLSIVEAYNPAMNQWLCSTGDRSGGCTDSSLAPLPTARSALAAATGSDGTVYAMGGYNGSYLATNELFSPPTAPGAPVSLAATAGDASATVSWSVPASTGGIPITGYTVSCSPSCTPVSATGTSATVTGLTNGTSYTFTVTATNFIGTGSSSSPSNAVTPAPSCSTNSSNLSVAGAAPGNFNVTLTGSDQQVYTTLASYSVANTTCSGWSVQMQATPFSNGNGDQLPAGSLLMAPPIVSSCTANCGSGSTSAAPGVCAQSAVALDGGTAITIASAPINSGDGTYTFTPGSIAGAGTNLQLTVPSYAYAGTYTSTLTVTVVQGPAATC